MHDLYQLGLWNANMREYLIASGGSVQYIDGLPDKLKALYKTVWEIDQSVLIQQAIDRQPFVDQAQSLNLYMSKISEARWNKLMFQAWKGGLKTGKYYLHSRPAVSPHKFTIDSTTQEQISKLIEKNSHGKAALEPLRDICEVCSG